MSTRQIEIIAAAGLLVVVLLVGVTTDGVFGLAEASIDQVFTDRVTWTPKELSSFR